ncbi:MAG: HAD family phosphatase [Actinobacteria bacterium]|nr:HAD family phosphatase [Actinomycetota bacterium]
MAVKAVVFDLGNVLIEWNPRHLYRKVFSDEEAMEQFLATVCTMEWNDGLDRGHPLAEAVATLSAEYPEHAEHIAAYHERWAEMVDGAIDETVAVLAELRDAGVPLYALSNWSAETFVLVRDQFPFLDWFAGVLLSSEVGVTKPDVRIFETLCRRYGLEPAATLFIDDNAPNVDGARAAGLQAHHYRSAATLREELVSLRLVAGE